MVIDTDDSFLQIQSGANGRRKERRSFWFRPLDNTGTLASRAAKKTSLLAK